ncbi:MAG TPA: cobalamin-binding protein [Bacteroidetes bacterium]|nr:cobalamin-binding protein [Bacteroidota bacterium]
MDSLRHNDQMKREVWLPAFPERIVSLVPSQTEYLCAIGIGGRLVGRTQFCIHPAEELKKVVRIGGTKKLQLDKIRALQPDLIIGNKEENEQSQIEALAADFPVWMSDIHQPEDALSMMHDLGSIVNCETKAEALIAEIRGGLASIQEKKARFEGIRVLYAIWKSPWMFAGQHTFISSMLELAGFSNVCPGERYPELNEDEFIALKADLILLSSEPYPFSFGHIRELEAKVRDSRILLVNGEMFSWYGSRMTEFPAYLDNLFAQIHKKTP